MVFSCPGFPPTVKLAPPWLAYFEWIDDLGRRCFAGLGNQYPNAENRYTILRVKNSRPDILKSKSALRTPGNVGEAEAGSGTISCDNG